MNFKTVSKGQSAQWIFKLPQTIKARLRVPEMSKFVERANLPPACTGAYFPTRPFLLPEITDVAPRLLESPDQLAEAHYALNGLKFTDDRFPRYVPANSVDSRHGTRYEFILPDPIPMETDPASTLEELEKYSEAEDLRRNSVTIAVVNWLTEEVDCECAAQGNPKLTLDRYERLNRLINQIIEEKPCPKYIVLPELSLPRKWANNVAVKLSNRGISLIAGLEYESDGEFVKNEVLLSLSTSTFGLRNAVLVKQPKIKPSYGELTMLRKFGISGFSNSKISAAARPVYINDDFSFGLLICSDLTDINNRAHFQGHVDCLFVVEWNQDLATFNFLVEAAAHDIHAFIVQTNNRKYGDSRIRGPYFKDFKRDMVRVRGGDNDYYVIGKLECLNLRKFQNVSPPHHSDSEPDPIFKPYPIGFMPSKRRRTGNPHNTHFKLGAKYSRAHIQAVLGGSDVEYLPSVNDQVVCGCFRLDMNPEAPDVIIPGKGVIIEREAEFFCAQAFGIPIFIKRRIHEWEYVGNYKAMSHSNDLDDIAEHHRGSVTPINNVSRVIYLKRMDTAK